MEIKRFVGGVIESNCYVIYDRKNQAPQKGCYIIDPGYGAGGIIKFIDENNLKPVGILLTHHHYDHAGCVEKLRSNYGCPTYIHIQDMDVCKPAIDVALNDGDILEIPAGDRAIEAEIGGKRQNTDDCNQQATGEKLKVVHTPGHTKGSVCFFSEKSKLAFTGDTIFNVDLGRTDLEDGSEAEMKSSIKDIIDKWSNEIIIYPGHGGSCSMKYVRKENREFLDIVNEEEKSRI